MCGTTDFSVLFEYREPPEGETRFSFSHSADYYRRVLECGTCGHMISVHDIDLRAFYTQDYLDSTYGKHGLNASFQRIISLPPSQSDNAGRVARVLRFAEKYFEQVRRGDTKITLLDVGSGLCVFPYKMKKAGWECTVCEPDQRMVTHASETVGVQAICGDFMELANIGRFDVVTFNKILEHVTDPVTMLQKGKDFLKPGGFIYIELPDGEAAKSDGPGREEFFLEHYHIFSAASTCLLAKKAGFHIIQKERLQEPSTKYTLRAFLNKE